MESSDFTTRQPAPLLGSHCEEKYSLSRGRKSPFVVSKVKGMTEVRGKLVLGEIGVLAQVADRSG